jgi:hypothetical protein
MSAALAAPTKPNAVTAAAAAKTFFIGSPIGWRKLPVI